MVISYFGEVRLCRNDSPGSETHQRALKKTGGGSENPWHAAKSPSLMQMTWTHQVQNLVKCASASWSSCDFDADDVGSEC